MNERVISDPERRALEYIRDELPILLDHLIGTRDFALEINRDQSLGFDENDVALAALCHDLARLHDPEKIEIELRSRGIDPDSYGHVVPILLHGILSAVLAREKFGITDEGVLGAVRKHTTGGAEMTLLDKLIYSADKVEPNRDFPGIEELRAAVREDLATGYPRVLASVITWVVAEFKPLDYNSIAAWNQAVREHDTSEGRGA